MQPTPAGPATDTPQNTLLRSIAAAPDPSRRSAELRQALQAAGGPLLQRLPDRPDHYLVSFVMLDRPARPALRSALLPGLEASAALHPLVGIDDCWWLEVEVPADVCTSYQFQDTVVPFPAIDGPPTDSAAWTDYLRELYRAGLADPMNPHRWFPAAFDPDRDGGPADPPPQKWESVLSMPAVPEFRWHRTPPARGRVQHRRTAADGPFAPRDLTVWTPPSAGSDATGLPVVLLLDGEEFAGESFDAVSIFDNLAASGQVRDFIGVLMHNATATSRTSEYPCNQQFADHVADQVLPPLRSEFGIGERPADVVVGGFSYGGLAADWLALTRPDTFGAALSLSASLWWGKRPTGAAPDDLSVGRDDRPEWLTRNCPAAADHGTPGPRFWIEVGTLEADPIPFADGSSQLTANRAFVNSLQQHGYQVLDYREVSGGHDYLHWRRILPDGLIALLSADSSA